MWRAAEPTPTAPVPLDTPEPFRATNAQTLLDFVPPTFLGLDPVERLATAEGGARGTWQAGDQRIVLALTRIADVAATRSSYELLGRPAEARIDGHELRGLRLQGNPAQLSRQLDPPHTATLTAVAANTYLVELEVQPAEDLDELLVLAGGLDIGGMTRLALAEHKARNTPSPNAPTPR